MLISWNDIHGLSLIDLHPKGVNWPKINQVKTEKLSFAELFGQLQLLSWKFNSKLVDFIN